jgi:hypothetical protein
MVESLRIEYLRAIGRWRAVVLCYVVRARLRPWGCQLRLWLYRTSVD